MSLAPKDFSQSQRTKRLNLRILKSWSSIYPGAAASWGGVPLIQGSLPYSKINNLKRDDLELKLKNFT
jgi:hypothetical protein